MSSIMFGTGVVIIGCKNRVLIRVRDSIREVFVFGSLRSRVVVFHLYQ